MIWLNEWEVENHAARWDEEEFPNLHAGAQSLRSLMEWTNGNSDGWPYWRKPSRAASRLMTLLSDRAWGEDPSDITTADLSNALRPVKSFLTRHGVDWREVL